MGADMIPGARILQLGSSTQGVSDQSPAPVLPTRPLKLTALRQDMPPGEPERGALQQPVGHPAVELVVAPGPVLGLGHTSRWRAEDVQFLIPT